MEIVNSKQIKKEIKNNLEKYRIDKDQIKCVDFIIERFIFHMTPLLLHGYTLFVHSFKFSLVYVYYHLIPRYKKNKFNFSQKAFGYSFSIKAESEKMNKYGYSFRSGGRLGKVITDWIQSDVVYKLIKQ